MMWLKMLIAFFMLSRLLAASEVNITSNERPDKRREFTVCENGEICAWGFYDDAEELKVVKHHKLSR